MSLAVDSAFSVFDSAIEAEYAQWVQEWLGWPQREVSAHPAYARLFAAPGTRVLCAHMRVGRELTIMLPFIVRPIDDTQPQLFDVTAPYGYGGPWFWGDGDAESAASGFWQALQAWASDNAIVSEFLRFSVTGDVLPSYVGALSTRGVNYVVDLALDEESLWKGFEHKVRKNVNKARRNGVSIAIDETGRQLNDFIRIYEGTMQRRSAASGYYFSREFFETITHELAGQFVFAHAVKEQQVVSTELVLVSEESVYSFLGGTDDSAFADRPNDLLKFEVMLWAKRAGRKYFVLGGGAHPGDGIEQYKKAFAPHGGVDFHTGSEVHLRNEYEALVQRRRAQFDAAGRVWPHDSKFFPAYRMPL